MLPENSSLRVNLGQLGRFLKGKGITKADLTDTGVPCLRYAEIYTLFENVVTNLRSFVNPTIAAASTTLISGDIVFAASGETAEEIGKAVTYLGNSHAVVGSDTVILRNHAQDPFYLVHAVNSRDAAKQKARLGKGHSVVHIHAPDLAKIEIYLPPLPEQRKIAEILSKWDRAIEVTEKLIANARAQKKALMQHLLTGKKRLPGFKGKWRSVNLGDIGKLRKGKGIQRDQVRDSGFPCIRYGEIYTQHHEQVRQFNSFIDADTAVESEPISTGDILFTCSGETAEEIGKCVAYLGNEQAYAGGDIIILSPSADNAAFLSYVLNDTDVNEQKRRLGQGNSVVHISAANLSKLVFKLPDRAEQDAIASIIDTEAGRIGRLEMDLGGLRQEKSALMQQLLTGKRRVKIEEVVA